LEEHRDLCASDPNVFEQNWRRIGDGAERNLPSFVQAMDVADRQRAFVRIESAARRIEPEDRPIRREGRMKCRSEEPG
jgi:hypothetical protein